MNYRQAVLVDAESASAAATKIVDLKGLDPISQFAIQLKMTNNGSTPTAHPVKAIKKIELVDGSDILWSLSGQEAAALNFYQTDKQAVDIVDYVNDNNTVAMIKINMGRWLWDEDLAFDPNRFKNAQLKITHDKSLGGSAPDAATLSVIAKMFDEKKVNPFGWLMAKEYNTYSLVSSAVETIDLPTDYPMRMMMIQSLAAGKQPWEQFNKIKLSENNGKKIPIEDSISNLLKYSVDEFGKYQEQIYCESSTSEVTHYCAPTYETSIIGSEQNKQASYPIFTQSYGGSFVVDASAVGQLKILATGYAPHGAFPILFGDVWDANAWYDVTKLAKLELKVTAGSAVGSSSTCETVTEQFRRY